MSDNTQINVPSDPGQVIATEDVGGGVNMPRGKIALGAHGTDGGDVTFANPLPVELSDGTHGPPAIKAASIAAIASDPALVVALSPNSLLPLPTTNFAANFAAVNGSIKGAPGNVFSLQATNRANAGVYFQLFNSLSAPSSGATPFAQFYVPAAGEIIVGQDFFTLLGVNFSTGISFGFSTVNGSYTAATASNCDSQVVYQ